MELLNAIVITVNGVVWGWAMIILLLGTHIYMTAKTGFIQIFYHYKRNQTVCGKRYEEIYS